ncbi:hypothetical protein PQJ75_05500 [Rhodoplanes sp. TEM]|uniref:Uncharacterized protein n=1 Tax=Rhodoplanes tepidamans TaxID=200616 RepID=A0ABT5J3D0_RHOTP|nr:MULTISPECIES: hypothetical protein [Rhodoplanes]MDC7784083.1 hypothetical protein [Rhodoplanes tepidamans]MDC7983178.1 hypothetical protein [Rhodoplanes sp. TEM]MDQ0356820.1 hypothetical protein [Rhodoplanes tepidamans]
MNDDERLKDAKRLMGALVRKAPKPHEDMKVGKRDTPGRPGKRTPPPKKDALKDEPDV